MLNDLTRCYERAGNLSKMIRCYVVILWNIMKLKRKTDLGKSPSFCLSGGNHLRMNLEMKLYFLGSKSRIF